MFASMCRQAHIIRRSRHHWQCQHHLPKANIISKKKSTSYEVLFFLEAPPRFELGNKGFADLCLTTWLWRHIEFSRKRQKSDLIFVVFKWSGLRGSNPPPRPWQGRALPNELNPHTEMFSVNGASGRNRTNDTRIFSPLLYQLSYRGI